MKIKRVIALLACVLLGCFALGATGAVQLARQETGEETREKDRLIGVLVTQEHLDLFDAEGYFQDHADTILSGGELDGAQSEAYQGRLYAALRETAYPGENGEAYTAQEYVFEGVDGYAYFCALYEDETSVYHGSNGHEAISDGHTGIHSTDAGDSLSLEGTIYVSTTGGADSFYYNPIYQSADGAVYAMTGQGMSFGGDFGAGMSSSHSMKEESTVTSGQETDSVSTEIKITVCYIDPPEGVTLVQLDGDSRVLSRRDYAPGALPDTLITERDTACLLVETHGRELDGHEAVTRQLYQPGDESLYAFFCREDGVCVKQYCGLSWPGEEWNGEVGA